MKTDYNGWKNRQTWNVALWINNNEPLYRRAVNYMKNHPGNKTSYIGFVRENYMMNDYTPDRIKWNGTRLDYKALNEMMLDLIR